MEILDTSKRGPYIVEVKEGKSYAWCQCAESHSQPFCDGSHKKTPIKPKMFTAHASEKIALCGCKQTNHQPYCDETHKKL